MCIEHRQKFPKHNIITKQKQDDKRDCYILNMAESDFNSFFDGDQKEICDQNNIASKQPLCLEFFVKNRLKSAEQPNRRENGAENE